MDVAATSVAVKELEAMQEASISALKMAMDTVDIQATDFIKLLEANLKVMEQSVNPHIGGNIDIKI